MSESTRIVAILGHHGGSGRTVTTVGLAMALSRAGHKVQVLDRTSDRICRELLAEVSLPNLELVDEPGDVDIVLVDTPAMGHPAFAGALHGVTHALLTARADLSSLRAMGLVAESLSHREELAVSGLVFTNFDPDCQAQVEMRSTFRARRPDLEIAAPVVTDDSWTQWVMGVCAELPEGRYADAHAALGRDLLAALGMTDEQDRVERRVRWCRCGESVGRGLIEKGLAWQEPGGDWVCRRCSEESAGIATPAEERARRAGAPS